MGRLVAFVSACMAWIVFCAPAACASGIFAEAALEGSPEDVQYLSGLEIRKAPLASTGIFETPSLRSGLHRELDRRAFAGSVPGWNGPTLSPAAAVLFSSRSSAAGTTYYIDPHTFCVASTATGYGTCETCAPAGGTAAGGSSQGIGGSSPHAPQPFFMAVAGLTLICLAILWRNRSLVAPAQVQDVRQPVQTWKPRSWKYQSSAKAV